MHYRERAALFRAEAETVLNNGKRRGLLQLAEMYEALAAGCEQSATDEQ